MCVCVFSGAKWCWWMPFPGEYVCVWSEECCTGSAPPRDSDVTTSQQTSCPEQKWQTLSSSSPHFPLLLFSPFHFSLFLILPCTPGPYWSLGIHPSLLCGRLCEGRKFGNRAHGEREQDRERDRIWAKESENEKCLSSVKLKTVCICFSYTTVQRYRITWFHLML